MYFIVVLLSSGLRSLYRFGLLGERIELDCALATL